MRRSAAKIGGTETQNAPLAGEGQGGPADRASKTELTQELERLVCWVNLWGDEDKHTGMSLEWRRGYQRAMRDVLPRVQELAPDWLDTWRAEFVGRAS